MCAPKAVHHPVDRFPSQLVNAGVDIPGTCRPVLVQCALHGISRTTLGMTFVKAVHSKQFQKKVPLEYRNVSALLVKSTLIPVRTSTVSMYLRWEMQSAMLILPEQKHGCTVSQVQ